MQAFLKPIKTRLCNSNRYSIQIKTRSLPGSLLPILNPAHRPDRISNCLKSTSQY